MALWCWLAASLLVHAHGTPVIRAPEASDAKPPPGPGGVMNDLLQWAIQHSDPERLKELMEKYQNANLTIKDVYGQDVIDALLVNEPGIMKDAILLLAEFRNPSVEEEALVASLWELRDIVEQVDNARNLHVMGGLRPLVELGTSSERESGTRAEALWTLGVAMQNNEPVQEDVLSIDGLPRLVARLPVCEGEGAECLKLLFALSGLVRNSAAAQVSADDLGLFRWLLDVGIEHTSQAVVEKCLGLLETVFAQSPELPTIRTLAARQGALSRALLRHLDAGVDAEKVLALLAQLLALRPLLFDDGFRPALTSAMQKVLLHCRQSGSRVCASQEADDCSPYTYMCESLQELAAQVDSVLGARAASDDEL